MPKISRRNDVEYAWAKAKFEAKELERSKKRSGQLRLRMPKDLHAFLAELAKSNGVSLNTYIVSILSKVRAKGNS